MNIGFIGAGKMAKALIDSILLLNDIDTKFVVSDIDTKRLDLFRNRKNFQTTKSNMEVVEKSDIIFLAVKPQNIENVLNEIKNCDKLIVSIAAGVPIDYLEKKLKKSKIIRIMLNISCLIGEMAGGFSLGSKKV